jgi:hypothetical protein
LPDEFKVNVSAGADGRSNRSWGAVNKKRLKFSGKRPEINDIDALTHKEDLHMKKKFLAAGAALLCLSGTSFAAEFQPLGTLGIGGAGVARQNGALTAYWNPAGGAFNDKSFSFITGAQFGAKGNDGFTQNVDRLNGIDFNKIKTFNDNATPETFGDVVKLVSVLNDIKNRNGNLAMTASAPVGFSIKHFSFGLYGNMEGYAQPVPDTVNILPTTAGNGSSPVTPAQLLNAVGTNDPGSVGYFSPSQHAALVATIEANGIPDPTSAIRVADFIEAQLKSTGIPADTALASATSLVTAVGTGSSTNTIDHNTTSVITKALLYVEAPLAYGHPFDLGEFGVLGIGASVKIIQGTVYQSQVLLLNTASGSSLKSGDLFKEMTKNSETSTNFGLDFGALWKYQDKLSVGIVAKNVNSPKFKAPTYQAPVANNPSLKTDVRGSDVTLDMQVRSGIAYDPLPWLTIAADLDLTENSAVVPSNSVKTRNLGGGLEIHPYSWLKVRAGAYKNLASSEGGPVATAGLSIGPLDLDVAASTDTFKVGSTTLPQEAKAQLMCGFTF